MPDEESLSTKARRTPWNKGKLIGAKPPLRATLSNPYGEAEYRSAFSSIQRDQLDGLIPSDEGHVLLPPPASANSRYG